MINMIYQKNMLILMMIHNKTLIYAKIYNVSNALKVEYYVNSVFKIFI